MKLQDVILNAMARKLTWMEAAEIAGMSVCHLQRRREAYQKWDTHLAAFCNPSTKENYRHKTKEARQTTSGRIIDRQRQNCASLIH